MTDATSYREKLQSEMEESLRDVLLLLKHGNSKSDTFESAKFIEDNLFNVPAVARSRAILDPRVVASLEGVRRLFNEHRRSEPEIVALNMLSCAEWFEFSHVVLRLELFCLIFFNKSGSVIVREGADQWISIPGTSLYVMIIEGNRKIRVERGTLNEVEVFDARLTTAKQRNELPFIALPETPLLPPIANKRFLLLSLKEREEWACRINSAFSLLHYHGPSLALVKEYAWLVAPLEDEREGYFSSISFNILPNAIYTSLHTDLMFAETFVHEADHQWLYLIARFEDFWLVPDYLQEPIYRSPWRDDPRPLDGILRGASAFVRVGSMWASLAAESLPNTHTALHWISNRAVLCNYQAMDALKTVQKHGNLSTFGRKLLVSLVEQAVETRKVLSKLEHFTDSLKRAEKSQREHDAAWLLRNPVHKANSSDFCASDYVNYGMPI